MLKSQDLLPLLVLLQQERYAFTSQYALAQFLEWSPASLHRSLQRSEKCSLWFPSQNRVSKESLKEFLRYGLRYVFPAECTAPCRGVITACLPMTTQPELPYVWPNENGKDYGIGLQPLDSKFSIVAKKAPELAPLLHCTEVFRLGRKRELILAENYFDSLVSLKENSK